MHLHPKVPGWLRRAYYWAGHFSNQLMIGFMGLVIVRLFLPKGVANAAPVVWVPIGILLFSIVAIVSHNRKLCERCIAEVPLDGSQRAERQRRKLRFYHFQATRRGVLLSLGLLGLFCADAWLPLPNGVIGLVQSILGLLLLLLLVAKIVYGSLSFIAHRKLQIWCPQCRDDGGDGDLVEEPDPDPSTKRPAPAQ